MILLAKHIGETPLEALMRLRKERPEFQHSVLSYAGRLDPMASGLLLVLEGEENKKREEYLELDKEYEMEILYGVETDTFDPLGLIICTDPTIPKETEMARNAFLGTRTQTYPIFSSKTVKGIPLHTHARKGTLPDELPQREVTIHSIELLERSEKSGNEVAHDAIGRIGKVAGDFRQSDIIASWNGFLERHTHDSFLVERVRVSCGSGAYMRALAHDIGRTLRIGALALSIKRTAIGPYRVEEALLS